MSGEINLETLRGRMRAISTRALSDRTVTPGEADDVLALIEAVECAYNAYGLGTRRCYVCDVRARSADLPATKHQLRCPGELFDFGGAA